jgi:serine/threonine-protein kinase
MPTPEVLRPEEARVATPQVVEAPANVIEAPRARPQAAAVPAVPAPKTAPAPPAVAPANATVTFAISPWGEVFFDGKSVGISPPLATLQLTAGTHRVEIRNQSLEPYRDTVNLEPGQSLKIRHKFK